MKRLAVWIPIIIMLITGLFALDSRYGLDSVQAENTADIQLIRLERVEEVYQRRYIDLKRDYGDKK